MPLFPRIADRVATGCQAPSPSAERPRRTAAGIAAIALCLGLCAVRGEPSYVKAADNKVYAQSLLNEIAANNPDLVVVGFHAFLPGAKDSTVIASNLDRVGKKDDDDDVAAAKESKIICGPRSNDATRYEVEMPLKDASGKTIGGLSLIFKDHVDGDEARLITKAIALREGVAKKIPNFDELLKKTP